MTYLTTIGLEVHAELNTKSKMFCGCKNEPHGSEPNANICPVCMAHPGTLPVPNEQAIEMVLLFGRAVGAQAADFSEFDRKNYFYPDIPKAYQISQYAFPFLTGGELEGVELTRVHLEEDTARSQHDKGKGSVVDFNRAGVPLMELVTEPVIHDAKTAGNFARELQLLLRTLGISSANMEKGEMRVEANISVSKEAGVLGTKVEVKNLNSFKSVESAIEYEVNRQIECLESDQELNQETRGWDEVKLRTFVQRTKETAKDYRYFPDPDIPKIKVSEYTSFDPSRLDEIMPKLPKETREFYINLGLTSNTIEVLLSNIELDIFLKDVLKLSTSNSIAKLAANYVTSDLVPILSEGEATLSDLQPAHFRELMVMIDEGKIGSRVAKDLLPALFGSNESPLTIATEKDLLQMSDSSSLAPIIDEIISENESVVMEYKEGKEASLKFLVGQGMKKTRGSADPQKLEDLLRTALK
jgi:aspartyl-tRNA(Asn)/glutamyl-tRNA(Gln) amidotransferase subunit B